LHAGTYAAVQPTVAAAFGPARATVDGTVVEGYAQNRYGGPLAIPLPITVGARESLGAHVELNVDLGWFDAGVGLRVASPDLGRVGPLVLSGGLRSGCVSVFGDATYEARLALEAYPLLVARGERSPRLILSLGVATGTFAHELELPSQFMSDSDAPVGPPNVLVLRPEVRLLTSIGVYALTRTFGLAAAVFPWFVVRSSDPVSIVGQNCEGHPVITNFEQTWGVSLSLTPSFGHDVSLRRLQ
jgi:hypothetical protein